MNQKRQRWAARALVLAAGMALAACASQESQGEDSAQVLTGQVARHNFSSPVVGVRAVRAGAAVAWSPVDQDGRFALVVPVGAGNRLEVVTAAGSHGFVARGASGARAVEFDVCGAGVPFDVGHVHGWNESGEEQPGAGCGDPIPCGGGEEPYPGDGDGQTGDPGDGTGGGEPGECPPPIPCDEYGNCCFPDGTCCGADGKCCFPDGTCCDAEGNCCTPDGQCTEPPPPCDPDTDPSCCDAQDPDGTCPPKCEPGDDGQCDDPPPCDPATDPSCVPPCDPEDPDCCEYPAPDGTCPPKCEPGPDGRCEDPPPPAPCDDYDDPACWPQPEAPPCESEPGAGDDDVCWGSGAVPENAIPDFGCATGGAG